MSDDRRDARADASPPAAGDEPVRLSGQKARQADGNWTPLRVLVIGLALCVVAFVVSWALGY